LARSRSRTEVTIEGGKGAVVGDFNTVIQIFK
jgi:hypothetical protein